MDNNDVAQDLTLCIGAGPAGLTAAYELARHDKPVLVLELDERYVGGIARTVCEEGFRFDIGGHRFFSKSDEIVALWKELLGDELLLRPRKSRIYYGGKFYPYPLDLRRTLLNLGIIESARCVLSYGWARVKPCRNPVNFEQWVTNRFGARLYRIFFKTYTEKVWGMPCHEISADWAAQRIKGLSLSTAVGNALKRMLGIKRGGKGAKSLIEAFYYPRQGPGMMWEAAMRAIQQKGSRVQLGSGVEKLEWEAQAGAWRVTYRQQGISKSVSARHIISTMPLRELLHAVSHATEQVCTQAGQLQYRDFLIVSLVLEDKGAFNDNWLYIHDPDVKVGRIQNFKSWSADMVPDDNLVCYGMEYFCFEGDGLWAMEDAQLIDLATQELRMLGLSQDNPVLHGYVTRQRKAYPVYDEHYYERVQSIRSWLEAYCPNLQMVGRNGMHKYNNQDHSMMTALLAARNILAGERCYDVWNVNEDAEYHEEIAVDHGGRQVPTTV